MTCSARSFSEASRRSSSPSPGFVVPAIGFTLARVPSSFTSVSGEEPIERQVAELEQEEVGRGIDAPQRPVDRDGRRRGGPLRPLREDDLEGVAGADVLLGREDGPLVGLPREEAPDRAARVPAARAGLLQRACKPCRDLVDVAGEHLRDPGQVVEADERVRDDEEALREVGPVRGQPNGRLQPRDMVVAEVAHHRCPSLDRALGVLEREQPGARAERGCSGRGVPARPTRAESSARRRAGAGTPRAG